MPLTRCRNEVLLVASVRGMFGLYQFWVNMSRDHFMIFMRNTIKQRNVKNIYSITLKKCCFFSFREYDVSSEVVLSIYTLE